MGPPGMSGPASLPVDIEPAPKSTTSTANPHLVEAGCLLRRSRHVSVDRVPQSRSRRPSLAEEFPLRRHFLLVLALVVTASASFLTIPTVSASESRPVTSMRLKRVTPGPVVTGSVVKFTGTAPRRLAGSRVSLFRRVNSGSWVRVGRGRVRANGVYRVAGRASGVGANAWRAKVVKNRAVHVSKMSRHAVYRWYALSDSNAVDYDAFWYNYYPASIGSKRFSGALVADGWYANAQADQTSTSWNLSYQCIRLTTSYGLENSSATNGVGRFYISVDGATTNLSDKGLGEPSSVMLDVAGHMRVSLGMGVIADSEDATSPAYGDPRVLCKGDPF